MAWEQMKESEMSGRGQIEQNAVNQDTSGVHAYCLVVRPITNAASVSASADPHALGRTNPASRSTPEPLRANRPVWQWVQGQKHATATWVEQKSALAERTNHIPLAPSKRMPDSNKRWINNFIFKSVSNHP